MSKLDRGVRPSPKESATLFPEGYEAVGQDGNKWKISVTEAGVHRWVKEHMYLKGGTVSDSEYNRWSKALDKWVKAKKSGDKEEEDKQAAIVESISKKFYAEGGEVESEEEIDEPVGETAFGEIYKTEALGGSPFWLPDSVIYNGQDLQLVYLSPVYRVKNPDLIDIAPEDVLEDYTEDEIKELPAAPENIEEVIEEVEELDEPLDEEELEEAEQGAAVISELEAAESVPAEAEAAMEESTEVPVAVTEAAAETAEIVDNVAEAEVVNEGEPVVIPDTTSEVTTEQVMETTEGTITETITENPQENTTVTEVVTEPKGEDTIVTETITETPEEVVTETITEKPSEDTTVTETVTETPADDMIVTETIIETPEDIITTTVTEEAQEEPLITVEYEEPKSEDVEASSPETPEFKKGGFIDAQKMHKEYPKTFFAPSEKDLEKVTKGSYVKIASGGERFWVKVESVKGNVVKGTVDNDLLDTKKHGLKHGDTVTFLKKNIYATELPVKKTPKPVKKIVKKMEQGGGLHLNEYKFKVKHDHGTMTMKKVAESKEAAMKSICRAEGCPESALTFVEEKKLFATGGSIPNNYKGKTPAQVWAEWTPKQRQSFFIENIDEMMGTRHNSLSDSEEKKVGKIILENNYSKLPISVTSALNEHLSRGQFATGGSIPNYAGKTGADVWKSWKPVQRMHFLKDHEGKKEYSAVKELAMRTFKDLPKKIQEDIDEHISDAQYAKGGSIKKTVSVPKKKRIDLELGRIADLIKMMPMSGTYAHSFPPAEVKKAWMYYRDTTIKIGKGNTDVVSVGDVVEALKSKYKIPTDKAFYLARLFKDQFGAIVMGKLYAKGGGIGKKENPEKKFWAKHMKMHTALVRAKAVSEGYIKKGEKLTDEAISKLKKLGGIWKKRAISIANTKTYKKGGSI